MKKDFNLILRNIYLYLVCFITLIMIITSMVTIAQRVTDIAFPPNDYVVDQPSQRLREYKELRTNNKIYLSYADYNKMKDEEIAKQKEIQKQNAYRNLFNAALTLLIALPFYIYHWRKIGLKK